MSQTSTAFTRLYRRLNPEQKKAVDTIEGPVMVIAGPGTGKTQVLTLRIAQILRKTDASPESILALTFTEAGAHAMRKRLAEIIGSAAYRVSISTFHSFCAEIIRSFPDEFPRIIGSTLAPEAEQLLIFEKIVTDLPLTHLKPFGNPLYHIRAIAHAISDLKRENVNVPGFAALIKKEEHAFKNIPDLFYDDGPRAGMMRARYAAPKKYLLKNKELLEIYKEYEARLFPRKLYDYNDLILEVIAAFEKKPDFLLTLQERYLYFLADEHQDANRSQNRLLELLCAYHTHPNLFIVGDEKQAIFRFQGASLENFYYFQERYPRAKKIELRMSYRSTQTILNSAHSLLGKKARAPLLSALSAKGIKPKIYEFSKEEVEHFFVVEEIVTHLRAAYKAEAIAVLYRDNNDAAALSRALTRRGVPHVIESDENVFDEPAIQKVILLLGALSNFGKDEYLVPMLHIDFLAIEPFSVYTLLTHAAQVKKSLWELLKRPLVPGVSEVERRAIKALYSTLSSWHTLSQNRGLSDFFEIVLRESGALASILSGPRPVATMEKLDMLFGELKAFVARRPGADLADFVAYLSMVKTHHVLSVRGERARTGAVRLMTAHRAKGQEFETVFIVGAYDGHWGARKVPRVFHLPDEALGVPDVSDEDERRLFYVALTRAKKKVLIAFSRTGEGERERLPSRFLEELSPENRERGNALMYEKKYKRMRGRLLLRVVPQKSQLKDRELVKERFRSQGLSVTALNNYLRCPWEYFYLNLLRVPRALSAYQMYGTAVHYALTRFFAARKKGGRTSKKTLISFFREGLAALPLSLMERERYIMRGSAALGGYYDRYHADWTRSSDAPFIIRGIVLTPDVTLRGELDKVEYLGARGKVNVVDWKTGAPRSRRVIIGEAGDEEGNYYRQLVFYKLLLERYGTHSTSSGRLKPKYQMVSGEVDFVEPTPAGKYKKEKFEIRDGEVRKLEELIKKTAEEILNLKFWNRRCDRKDCSWCTLREMMGGNA